MTRFSFITVLLATLATGTAAQPMDAESRVAVLGAPYCPPRSVTTAQKTVIFKEFVQKLYVEKNSSRALLDHVPEDFIRHNPFALSGRDNGISMIGSFLTNVNFTIAKMGVTGEFAFIHTRVDVEGEERPTAIADMFRFNGSCIEEHWDVIQQVPENATNPLPMW